ncbi:hypothetical protein B4N89_18595 [Embleya scabrispora]|uniref:DUF6299 domain-containing protein n=1 Tax=Embleya scabrispora TaxID=159449 RepID=A0A1T3P0P8_9ACTN|nr:DUF6299 family protein [Embleya scabrispora]OPC82686.1 hypothetical protein B4N89_18595 [Embleya scabrispora]
MMISSGRTAVALSLGFAGLALAFVPVAAQAQAQAQPQARRLPVAGDQVSLDPTVWVTADGTVTISGTYRCSADHAGTVLVGGSVSQAGLHIAMGANAATCDGLTHDWRSSERPPLDFVPGPARGDATLLELRSGEGVVPVLPNVLAQETRDVTITRV